MIERYQISPDEMQTKFDIPMMILTNNKTNRNTLVFYIIKLFEQIISLKLSA